ncbi:hypothetical protein [Pseudomonas typographi]|uniref:Uncharacterized protein n=1 Tax=Pseudomonas typographi TaxID=2715964 RepID=A0ABR7Z909_9PSED|nr:hypothetical protein [Pseudomonas typographi]MBD1601962.1 hypothetical protein [Pseudomonas typographi]
MSTEKMREEFEAWLLEVHGLTAEWQPERNCFKEYPAHLAYQAWQASRAALLKKQAQEQEEFLAHLADFEQEDTLHG